jgi:hypothetical protein
MTTQPTIKPIETHYRGYRFRSRLEARWAVFMTTAGIPYSYEPEGFEISAEITRWNDAPPVRVQRFYLPDFWLPVQDHFLEIKPAILDECGRIEGPDVDLVRLQEAFEQQTGKQLIILCGEPGRGSVSNLEPASYCGFTVVDCDYEWCECGCGAIGLQYEGRAERNKHRTPCPNGNYIPRLDRAYTAARAARFEHGEQP